MFSLCYTFVDNHKLVADLFQPMTTAATRLINLIILLQRRPNQQAGDLAREPGVTGRHRSYHKPKLPFDRVSVALYNAHHSFKQERYLNENSKKANDSKNAEPS